MAFPRAVGHPDYTNDSTSRFIPELWSGKLVKNLYDTTCLGEITNTDYEGEIKSHGDRVVIRTTPTATINTYAKGQKLNYERVESPAIEMYIDKGYYWAFTVDRVDKFQMDIPLLDLWASDAAERLKINIDQNVLGSIYADVNSANKGLTAGYKSADINLGVTGTPLAVTKADILDKIVDVNQVLSEQNVPEEGRFLVLPAWACSLIKKSDLKDASLTGDATSVLRTGVIGTIDNLKIIRSNLLTISTDGGRSVANCIFGHKMATSFATQITETETLKAESTFGDLVRGLVVFGYKVVKSEALGHLYIYKA